MASKPRTRHLQKAHRRNGDASKRQFQFLLAQLSETLPVKDQSAFQLVLRFHFHKAMQGPPRHIPFKIVVRNFFFFKSLQGVALHGRR